MTIMFFCDVRGFTGISETLDAQGLTRFINMLLTPPTGEILERRGTIDKYLGDAIMAFWNALLPNEQHADLRRRSRHRHGQFDDQVQRGVEGRLRGRRPHL